jgi:hypothetical protein
MFGMTAKLPRVVLATALLSAAMVMPAEATDRWVSGTGDDTLGNGSSGNPFRTISMAMNVASNGDVIKVLTGDYDVNAGESFPIPVKDGVDVLGQESALLDYPRIGGDVGDSLTRSFLEIVANTADGQREGIIVRKLRFVGESIALEDAPSAVYAENAEGYCVDVTLDACIIERGAMNDSGQADRASVVGVAGAGQMDGDIPVQGLNLVLVGCHVTPTARGVEVGLGADAVSPDGAFINLEVRDGQFVLTGSQTAVFAVDYLLEGYSGETGLQAWAEGKLNGNQIDSRDCTSTGFADGILVGADARFGANVNMPHSTLLIEDNTIMGCDRAGLAIFCDQDGSTDVNANVQLWDVSRNVLAENGSHGMLLDFGDGTGSGNGAYLHVRATSNMIVDNGASGVWISNVDTTTQGFCYITNATISGNGGYGIELASSSQPEWLAGVQNSIVWDNTSGTVSGWSTSDGTFTNNDWEGLFGSPSCTQDVDGNVDTDPDFVSAGTGNYHLDSGSCLINKGTNSPESLANDNFELDFEGNRRVINGSADIGADEAG